MTTVTKKISSVATTLLLCCLVLLVACPAAHAAKSDTLSVELKIENYGSFWDAYYFVKDVAGAKPVAVKLEWSIGDNGKPTTVILVQKNEPEGSYKIPSKQGDVVNIRVYAADIKGKAITAWNFQMLNNGQKEVFTITAPSEFLPDFNRS